jgi:hypothetical protein
MRELRRKSHLYVDSSHVPFLMGKSCGMKSEAPPRLVELWLNSGRPGKTMQELSTKHLPNLHLSECRVLA